MGNLIVEWKDQAGNTLTRLDDLGVLITDLTPVVTPLTTTTYTVRQVDALNLVLNGNFDPPPTNPASISDYQYIAVPNNFSPDYARGFFTIQDNPQDLFDSTKYAPNSPNYATNWYRSVGDHTSGHGNMFIANGSTIGSIVYKATVNVTAGTMYYVGAWFANINESLTNPYNMDIYVKGVKIGNLSGALNDNWYQKYAFWTATATETVNLEFRNNQLGAAGNDFAIDDILFSPIVESTVNVIVKNPSSSTTTASICLGSNYTFNGIIYNTSGTYSDTFVNAVGCDSVATLILKVNSPTIAPVLKQTICEGESVAFYGNSYNTTGIYYKHLTNVAGCDSLVTLDLSIYPVIVADILGTTGVCKDSVAEITFVAKDGYAPYTFTYNINGGASQSVTSIGDIVKVTVATNVSGVFSYNLVNVSDSKGCSFTQSGKAVITVYEPLTATIEGVSSICKDSTARVLFTGKGGESPYTFTYNINGDTNQTVSTITGDTVSVVAPTSTSGTFSFNLISVVDSKKCPSLQDSTVTVNVIDCFVNIIIPNAFTPNADGYNDLFGPITEGIETIDMTINDRNGRFVYSIDQIDNKWDGLMPSGEQAPVGVYFYNLNAVGLNKNSYTRQGSVSLFRELIDTTPIQVTVTPNPVRQNARVDLSNQMNGVKTISICNTSGKQIKTWNTSDDIIVFDFSNFKQGLYIMKITGNQQIQFVKFIKD